MSERKAPERHPSFNIDAAVFDELNYRVYLRRLEPPLTLEEAATYLRIDDKGHKTNDASLRRNARAHEPLTRAYLRVLADMGMWTP